MSNQKTTNILFAGVGGQGVLLVAELAARSAIDAGWDAKKTEVHGAAQRGGSVVSHVRYGKKVYSPLIPSGEADILMGLEKLEALRWSHYVREGGLIVLNNEKRIPAKVDSKPIDYPENISEFLSQKGFDVRLVDATSIASNLGDYRAANIVLLGIIVSSSGIPADHWIGVMKKDLNPKVLELNLKAFGHGMDLAMRPQKV